MPYYYTWPWLELRRVILRACRYPERELWENYYLVPIDWAWVKMHGTPYEWHQTPAIHYSDLEMHVWDEPKQEWVTFNALDIQLTEGSLAAIPDYIMTEAEFRSAYGIERVADRGDFQALIGQGLVWWCG